MGISILNLFPNRFQESIFHPLTRLQIPALTRFACRHRIKKHSNQHGVSLIDPRMKTKFFRLQFSSACLQCVRSPPSFLLQTEKDPEFPQSS
jgi:hypothetical protein